MHKTILIGVSGKKQAGKSSLCRYLSTWLYSNYFSEYNFQFIQNKDGSIYLTDYIEENIEKCVKVYNFADSLKQLCIDLLNIPHDQVYGNDEQKNMETSYIWDYLPLSIRLKYRKDNDYVEIKNENGDAEIMDLPRQGSMTSREILQVVGTDIFREMFDKNIWVNYTIRNINKENPPIAFVADVRFKTEVTSILKENGYIIRLKRKVSSDRHESEIDLDHFDFEEKNNCVVIDNSSMSLEQQAEAGLAFLKEIIKKDHRFISSLKT